jgi:hypothetical protein
MVSLILVTLLITSYTTMALRNDWNLDTDEGLEMTF